MATRLERLVGIDAYIRAGHYPSLEKLCQIFEVQPRTIYQDLRELREMFALDIRFDRGRNGYYNATPAQQLPPLAMTYDEALLVAMAIEMLACSLGPTLRGTLARTCEMFTSHDEDGFVWLTDCLQLADRADCQVKSSVLLTVLKAASRRNKTLLQMNSESEKGRIVARPSRLYYECGHWNLEASLDGAGDIAEFHLCTIEDVQIVD